VRFDFDMLFLNYIIQIPISFSPDWGKMPASRRTRGALALEVSEMNFGFIFKI
jgi:hypothetical protein